MTRPNPLIDLLGIELPLMLAPMAGPGTTELAIAVSEAGGLGSLPCAMSSPEIIRRDIDIIRQRTARPLNVNFFCHTPPTPDPAREAVWKQQLAPYYQELGLDPATPTTAPERRPFDDAACRLIEEFRPRVVSFHFGLPTARAGWSREGCGLRCALLRYNHRRGSLARGQRL